MTQHNNRAIVQHFWEAINRNDFRLAAGFLHDDYLLEWPQSGERIRGRNNFIAVNEHYPAAGPWRVTIHRLIAQGDQVASEVTVTDGLITARAITFRARRRRAAIAHPAAWSRGARHIHWPDPFEAGAWRSQWVERMP